MRCITTGTCNIQLSISDTSVLDNALASQRSKQIAALTAIQGMRRAAPRVQPVPTGREHRCREGEPQPINYSCHPLYDYRYSATACGALLGCVQCARKRIQWTSPYSEVLGHHRLGAGNLQEWRMDPEESLDGSWGMTLPWLATWFYWCPSRFR